MDVRDAALVELDYALASFPLHQAYMAGDRLATSTASHWFLVDIEAGGIVARGRGRVLAADAGAGRILVIDGTSLLERDLRDGSLLREHVVDIPDRAFARQLVGGFDRAAPRHAWVGWITVPSGGVFRELRIYSESGEVRSVRTRDPWRDSREYYQYELRGDRLIIRGRADDTARRIIHSYSFASPERNETADADGFYLSLLPSGEGYLTALDGVVRVYRWDGTVSTLFAADWDWCGVISETLLACLRDAVRPGVGGTGGVLALYEEGQWSTPLLERTVSYARLGEPHFAGVVVDRVCSGDGCSASVISADGSVPSTVPLEYGTGPLVGWNEDGRSYAYDSYRLLGISTYFETEARAIIHGTLRTAASSDYVAVLTTSDLLLMFDARSGALRAAAALDPPTDWSVALGGGIEIDMSQLMFSHDQRWIMAKIPRADTMPPVSEVEGRHYSIRVFDTTTLERVASHEVFRGVYDLFAGDLLGAGGVWYRPPAWDDPLDLPVGVPTNDATMVASASSLQVTISSAEGSLINAFAGYSAFTWLPDNRLVLFRRSSADLAAAEGLLGSGLPLSLYNPPRFSRSASDARAVCVPSSYDAASDRSTAIREMLDTVSMTSFLVNNPYYEDVDSWAPSYRDSSCPAGVAYERSDWEVAIWRP